jgi:hypothetical protein
MTNVTNTPHRSLSSSPLTFPKVACASKADAFASKPADDDGYNSLKLLSVQPTLNVNYYVILILA